MKKLKLFALLLAVLIVGNSFAYSQSQLQNNIEKRLIKIEYKIYKRAKSFEKFCKLSDNFYEKLIKKLKLYQSKYPKYKKIYNTIILVSKKRQVKLSNKCNVYLQRKQGKKEIIKIKNNQQKKENTSFRNPKNQEQTNNIKKKSNIKNTKKENNKQNIDPKNKKQDTNSAKKKDNIKNIKKEDNKQDNNTKNNDQIQTKNSNPEKENNTKKTLNSTLKQWDFKLKSLIDKKYLQTLDKNKDIKINLKLTLPKVQLKKINQASEFFKSYVKIWNNWYFLPEYKYMLVEPKDIDYILQKADYYLKNNKADYFIYWNYWNKIKVILATKGNIVNTSFISPKKSIDENLKNIEKLWWLYINEPIYSYVASWLFLWGLINVDGDLFFLVQKTEKIQFLIIKDNTHLHYSIYNLHFPLYVKNNDKILWFPADIFDFYYIWPARLYNKVNIKQLGKVLFSNFQRISFHNYNYSVSQMYKLLDFSTKFDNKKLSDIWKWQIKNLKYNSTIEKLSKTMNYEQFVKYLEKNKYLGNNWIIFHTLTKKEWVCETFSDLLSILAILNWLNWDIIQWKVKNSLYSHQLSKINNYYYDPTYGIGEKNYNHFWMNWTQLTKYFIPEKK